MRIQFDLDVSKCSACGACAIACMDQNDIDVAANERPFRRVFRSEERNGQGPLPCDLVYYSVACMHCDDAACILACPTGCIYKDPETNLTLYDNTDCIGCHSCALACPFGAPSFSKEGKMQKCDGCIERIRHGMIPACVRVCPTGALQLLTEDSPGEIKTSLLAITNEILKTSEQ